jgi:HAD superfamily hydrolase (TIGR01484 family)
MKKLIVFDLDGTLAPSKSALAPQTAALLRDLLAIIQVAVISGGAWAQFEKQLLTDLPQDSVLANLSLLPTCGTKFFQFKGKWEELYSEDLSPEQREKIIDSLDKAATQAGCCAARIWGDVIEDRGSQVTFSALGQQAPLEEKERWDPDFEKRKKITTILETLIPEFSIRMGGATSIDITKPGIDKGYGIRKLRDTLHISVDEMVYIGDALFPGGNDYPAEQAGVVSIPIKGPDDTNLVIKSILACLGDK